MSLNSPRVAFMVCTRLGRVIERVLLILGILQDARESNGILGL